MKKLNFGVIFDMDGVIINNNHWHVKSWLEFASGLGIDLREEEFPTKVFGKTNEQILSAYFPDASADQLLAWALEKEAIYRDMYRPHFELAEGLLHFLERLKRQAIKIGVASNAPLVNVEFALDEGNIRSYFDAIVYAGMVDQPKPAPDIYQKAAKLLGYLPSDCFVIEDSPPGLQAALAAESKPIAITSTYSRSEVGKYTSFIINHFDELEGEWWNRQ